MTRLCWINCSACVVAFNSFDAGILYQAVIKPVKGGGCITVTSQWTALLFHTNELQQNISFRVINSNGEVIVMLQRKLCKQETLFYACSKHQILEECL